MRSALILGVLSLLPCVGCLNPARVTPQRPTFSSSTTTTAAGTAEIETGLGLDPGDFFDTPTTVKVGVSETSELFIGWSPFQWIEKPGSNGRGVGDLTIGTRQRFMEETESSPAAAFQLSTKLPTADEDEGLGSGEVDFRAAGIVSKQIENVALTGFYQLGFLGEVGDEDIDLEHGLAVAGSIPVADQLSLFGEMTLRITPEADQEELFTIFGAAYEVNESLVLDGALLVGLSPDAPDFQILIGLTHNLGEIFSAFRGGSEEGDQQP